VSRKLLFAGVTTVVLGVSALFSSVSLAAGCEVSRSGAKTVYSTLEEAATAAGAGSKLTVSGTCPGNTTITKDLTIVGVPKGQPRVATLKGTGSGTVLTIDAGVTVTLKALTITGGSAEFGGGIYNSGSLALVATTVTGNTTNGAPFAAAGAGIFNSFGSVTLTNSNVTGNTAEDFGLGGGIQDYVGSVTLTNSKVTGNKAYFGAGIDGEFDSITLTKSRVTGNTGTLGGGISDVQGSVTLTGSKVTDNTANQAGGIENVFGSLVLTATTVTGNSAELFGGGILNRGGSATLTNSKITGNSAEYGGGIYSFEPGVVTLEGSTFVRANKASAPNHGGGIFNAEKEGAKIVEVSFTGAVTKNTPENIYNEK
jgi:hypothetical protein